MEILIQKPHKNKQSIHSHPAALLAGVQSFDFQDSAGDCRFIEKLDLVDSAAIHFLRVEKRKVV